MNIEELAAKLNGRQRGEEFTNEEEKIAKENNLVIVYGASDDLMEFAGAINDEVGCYDGGTAYLTDKGLVQNECDDEECPYYVKQLDSANTIKEIWGDSGYSWIYETKIPHTKFTIFEDGEPYCEGIIFCLKDASTQSV